MAQLFCAVSKQNRQSFIDHRNMPTQEWNSYLQYLHWILAFFESEERAVVKQYFFDLCLKSATLVRLAERSKTLT